MLKTLTDRDTDYAIIDTHAVQYQGNLIATISPVECANSSLQLTDQQKEYYAFMIHAYDGPAHGKTFFAANEQDVAFQLEKLVDLNTSDEMAPGTVEKWQNKEELSHTITVLGFDQNTRHVFWMNSQSPSALCGTNEVDFTEVFRPAHPERDMVDRDVLSSKTVSAQMEL